MPELWQPIHELSVNALTYWQAHSLSNAGTNGSNRLLGRVQLLADGTETDACSGNILKHYHAILTAEHLEARGISLCPACVMRDGRRAAALVGLPDYKDMSNRQIICGCGLCDVHGYLITGKNAKADGTTETRQRLSKHSTIEFSFPLARPNEHAESSHLMTRMGASKEGGQMLMKMPSRSGAYAFQVRYKSVGIGVDTDNWEVMIVDEEQRRKRHQATLSALRDQVLSPSGARTSTMLPHLTGLTGVIMVSTWVGRAPMYSGLEADFIERLTAQQNDTLLALPFTSIDTFAAHMNHLIAHSYPCLPPGIRHASSALSEQP